MSRIGSILMNLGIVLLVLGAMILVAGLIVLSPEIGGGGSASLGGVVMIGPIPILSGTDRTALLIGVTGAMILMVIYLVFIFLTTRRTVNQ